MNDLKTRPKQPKAKDHYLKQDYEDFNLWIDYWYQQKYIEDTKPKKILEIGKGTGTLQVIMKKKGYQFTTLDIDKNLSPDIVGDVIQIPIKDNTYDTVCAFEVLEHLPFDEFSKAVNELKRVAKNYIIISLPYASFYLGLAFQPFYMKGLDFLFKLFKIKPFEPVYYNISVPFFFLDKEGMIKAHAWEVGRKNFPLSKIRKVFKDSGLLIKKESDRIFYPYHRYFILKKES